VTIYSGFYSKINFNLRHRDLQDEVLVRQYKALLIDSESLEPGESKTVTKHQLRLFPLNIMSIPMRPIGTLEVDASYKRSKKRI